MEEYCHISQLSQSAVMDESEWLNAIKSADKIALPGNDVRKIHYKFANGKEMVEEYSTETGVLTKRMWKKNASIQKDDNWEVEVGDLFANIRSDDSIQSLGIRESKDSPFVVHRVTKTKLEWRIRNLPYDIHCYNVTVDPTERMIVVRTTNKKFFKKIPILELQRLNVTPQQSALKFSHYMNTLVITYEKPAELVRFDEIVARELKNIEDVDGGDLDCKPS